MKKLISWDEKVVEDYRQRIIIDPDNPILALKASRDRFTKRIQQKDYAGLPHLGSRTSEDALTWNIFRSLQEANRLDIFTEKLGIGNPAALLIWTLAPKQDDISSELQYITGSIVRTYDGIFYGQMTEPDVILLGTSGIAVIECKLGEPGKYLSHLWEGSTESVNKRIKGYIEKIPNLVKTRNPAQLSPVYQLIRMAFYSLILGEHFNVEPVLVSLSNVKNWEIKIRRGKLNKTPAELWEYFQKDILWDISLRCENLFWQNIRESVKNKGLDNLYEYLSTQPCLPKEKCENDVCGRGEKAELKLTEYSPEVFFKLARHARERNLLKSWERSLLFNIGKYLKNEWKISSKMETQAYRIIKAAQDCGLWKQVEEELDKEEDYGERSKFDAEKKFEDSIRSPFTDEWSPARQYLQRAFQLETDGADPAAIQEQIDKAREVDAIYTDVCLGRWSLIKQRQSKNKHD